MLSDWAPAVENPAPAQRTSAASPIPIQVHILSIIGSRFHFLHKYNTFHFESLKRVFSV
jgi:hypothetical protein